MEEFILAYGSRRVHIGGGGKTARAGTPEITLSTSDRKQERKCKWGGVMNAQATPSTALHPKDTNQGSRVQLHEPMRDIFDPLKLPEPGLESVLRAWKK